MRVRLLLLLLSAVLIFGMVYVVHHMGTEADTDLTAKPSSPPKTEPPVVVGDSDRLALDHAAEKATPREKESPGSELPEGLSGEAGVSAATPVEKPGPALARSTGTAIEGYVFFEGAVLAGARVSWRPSHDSPYIPASWSAPKLDLGAIQHGAQADLTTENPLNPQSSNSIRLGGGYRAYDVALVRTFDTVPGVEYELSVDSRYVHGHLQSIYEQGFDLDEQKGAFGIDLTGQTSDHESPTVQYHSVVDGPNNCWRRFLAEFTAKQQQTAVWLRAEQGDAQIGCVWFDRIVVRPKAAEEAVDLLPPPPDEEEVGGDYVGSVLTGVQGFYRIEGLTPGQYDLLAASPGKGSAHRERIAVTAGETTNVDFNLLGGGVIRGLVVENITAEAIPGAVVTAQLPISRREKISVDGIPEVRSARCGNSGRFHLHSLLPGIPYYLTVEAPGYVPPRARTVVPDGGDAVFALSPVGGIFGTVAEQGTEQPVEDAVVRVFQQGTRYMEVDIGPGAFAVSDPDWTKRLHVAMTDESGRFAITGVKKGTYGLIAEKNGRKSTQISPDPIRVSLESDVDQAQVVLRLPRGGGLRGTAVDVATDQPAANVDLAMVMHSGPLRLRSHRYLIDETDITLIDIRTREGITRDLSWRDIFGGAPDDPTGDRLFKPRICFRTDETGRFELDEVGVGHYWVDVLSDGYMLAYPCERFIVDEGQTEVRVELRPLASIEGVVVDEGRLPVAGAMVWPKQLRSGEESKVTFFEEMGIAYSGADGRFRIPGVIPDVEFDLVATARGGRMGLVEGVKAGRTDVEIVLEPCGSIEGKIRFESGRPLVGAKVTALGGEVFGMHWWRHVWTDGEGRFRVHHLPKGVYDLDFGTREPELRAQYGPVRVDQGEEVTDLELVIPGNSRISGTVRFSDGTGAPGVVVMAAKLGEEGAAMYPPRLGEIQPNPWEDDREPELKFDILVYETLTDEAGDYVLLDLQPGVYEVKPSYPMYAAPHEMHGQCEPQTVEVGEEPAVGVEFELVEGIPPGPVIIDF